MPRHDAFHDDRRLPYAVASPLEDYRGSGFDRGRGRVEVPAFIYKAVYDPAASIAGVFVARNAPGQEFWRLSLAYFRKRSGIDPFPGLPASIEADASRLPKPIYR